MYVTFQIVTNMKKILFCLLLLPCLVQAQRLTVDSVLLKKQGVIHAKWVSVKTFSAIDTINEIQTLYNHNLYDIKRVDTTTRTKVLTRKATDSLINYALTGVVDTKGNWDASGNTLPSVGVKTGDKWTISVKGLVTDSLYTGDVIIAKIDNPGQTITNWNHIYVNQPKSVNIVRADATTNLSVLGFTGVTPTQGYFHGGIIAPVGNSYYLNFNGIFRSSYMFPGINGDMAGCIYSFTGSGYGSPSILGVNGGIRSNYSGTSNALSIYLSGSGNGLYINPSTGKGIIINHSSGNTSNFFETQVNSLTKVSIDYTGYLHNYKPTFSSVFYDSTRVIELDQNTPVIISNQWGNLWPNTKLVGFTENKDTAIVSYAGNYNLTFDFNSNVSASANFHYYIKKRAANSTAKTTVYRKEVSNSGTTVNRNITLNYDFSVGDRIWIEVENISNGTDITVYGGTYSITANYLNP